MNSSLCLYLCLSLSVCVRQTGLYSLVVVDGEDALDPLSPSLGTQYDLPQDRLTIAFWFSPGALPFLSSMMMVPDWCGVT